MIICLNCISRDVILHVVREIFSGLNHSLANFSEVKMDTDLSSPIGAAIAREVKNSQQDLLTSISALMDTRLATYFLEQHTTDAARNFTNSNDENRGNHD